MSRRLAPILVFCALIAWFLFECAMLWTRLPEIIATHFDLAGIPNGWSSHAGLLATLAMMLVVLGILFLSAGWLDRFPDRFVNLPNKDYWLAPGRRSDAFATLRDWMRWFLVIVLAFLVFVITAALKANLTPAPHLDLDLSLLLPVFLAAMLTMIGWLYWRFRLPKAL